MSPLTMSLDATRPCTALDNFPCFCIDGDTEGDATFGFLG